MFEQLIQRVPLPLNVNKQLLAFKLNTFVVTTDFFDSPLFKSKRPWQRFQDFRQSYR